MKLSDSVLQLNNIGDARAKRLAGLDIFTVSDLISHFPREYEDRSIITLIEQLEEGTSYTIRAKVSSTPQSTRLTNSIATKMNVKDKTGVLEIVWFNQPYMKNNFVAGEEYIFTGRVEERKGKKQMNAPDCEKPKEGSLNTGRIVPIYPMTNKLTQKLVRGYIKQALDNCMDELIEFLPKEVLDKYSLMPRKDAILNIHFPVTRDAFFEARRRLVFEEFFMLQMALFNMKGNIKKEKTDVVIANPDYSGLRLPFSLTNAQEKVVEEIIRDFKGDGPMYRLIQGDVGSGKTIVAVIACFIAISNGYQAAIMAPTEVLANQHLNSFTALFEGLGIKTVLLSGSMKKKEKDEAYEFIVGGSAQMIVGTHAIIQEKLAYHKLGLVITDEQHRFGVKQRAKLSGKGENPHVLVMSATPIPRTLALVLYGDMDISVINELPPGRQEISTFAVNSSYRERMFGFIEKQIEAGRQAYIICPAIEESEKMEVKNVTDYAEQIKLDYLQKRNLRILHGKMKPVEKQEIMDGFYGGEIDLIVSTTVIEVGVNVANATVIVVENAERFGLSQLHQLRGRVGRGLEKSYCILVSDAKGGVTKQRLSAMIRTSDGFEISELDLKLRGPGDFFGTKQHGLPEMKIANMFKDGDLLSIARDSAESIYEHNDVCENAEYVALALKLRDYLGINIDP